MYKRYKFGKLIAKACIDRDMSIRDAAKTCGVSYCGLLNACGENGTVTKKLAEKCANGLALTRNEYDAVMKCATDSPRICVIGLRGVPEEKRKKIVKFGKIAKRISNEDLDAILAKY